MSQRPCDNSVTCFPCTGDYSNPLANLSSEAPDDNIFISIFWPPFGPVTPTHWRVNACVGFCESSISQADADDCARRKALECVIVDPNPYCEEPPCEQFPPPTIYCNQFMSFQNGGQCYDMPSGSICALSQVEANALAQSIGNHRVLDAASSMACSSMPPAPPPPPPALDCPSEGAGFTPTLELPPGLYSYRTPLQWNTITINPSGAWQGDPDFPYTETDRDYPPGRYQLRYISGFWSDLSSCVFTPGGTLGNVEMDGGVDDEFIQDSDAGPNQIIGSLCYLSLTVVPDYAPCDFGPGGDSIVACEVGLDAIQTEFTDEFYFPDTQEELRWIDSNAHTNGGGNIVLLWDNDYAAYEHQPDYEFKVQMLQISGLRPQPRMVQIQNYNAIKPEFADQSAVALWPGIFDDRPAYTDTELRWESIAGGAFGGATISYITTHPTSANGRGFQLDIYSAGMVLMWRGFRGIGTTPLGRFYKDNTSTPVGPDCLVCEDVSELQWWPGLNPPS